MMKEVFTLESRRYQLFGNVDFLCCFFANSYRIFGRPWASRKEKNIYKVTTTDFDYTENFQNFSIGESPSIWVSIPDK